jgi:D-glycero-D-manno-heptose 1,7-bisphosphate phosphatase
LSLNVAMRRRGLFLDRDGTIVEHVDWLTRPSQLRLMPGAPEAIVRAAAAGFAVVVITNQPVVAHGLADERDVRQVHLALSAMLGAEGARIDAYYFCPHHPAGSVEPYRTLCACRKPQPGMIVHAARDLGLDLGDSVMVGDRLTDVAAGLGAGCKTVLLDSGIGTSRASHGLSSTDRPPAADHVCSDLIRAVDWALTWRGERGTGR